MAKKDAPADAPEAVTVRVTSDDPTFVPHDVKMTRDDLALIESAAGGLVTFAPDAAVRVSAAGLKAAITEARAAGYVVNLPFSLDALDRIAISETAKVVQ